MKLLILITVLLHLSISLAEVTIEDEVASFRQEELSEILEGSRKSKYDIGIYLKNSLKSSLKDFNTSIIKGVSAEYLIITIDYSKRRLRVDSSESDPQKLKFWKNIVLDGLKQNRLKDSILTIVAELPRKVEIQQTEEAKIEVDSNTTSEIKEVTTNDFVLDEDVQKIESKEETIALEDISPKSEQSSPLVQTEFEITGDQSSSFSIKDILDNLISKQDRNTEKTAFYVILFIALIIFHFFMSKKKIIFKVLFSLIPPLGSYFLYRVENLYIVLVIFLISFVYTLIPWRRGKRHVNSIFLSDKQKKNFTGSGTPGDFK